MNRNDLAAFIRKHRKKQGFKQKELAKLMGYTTSQFVSNWERAISEPPLKDAKKICELLNINQSHYKRLLIDKYKQEVVRAFE